MAKTKNVVQILSLVLAIVAVVGFGGFMMMSMIAEPDRDTVQPGESVFCANNPVVTGNVRIRDDLASDTTYLNGSVIIEDLATGEVYTESITGGAEYTELQTDLVCGHPDGYRIYVVGSGDDLNSHDAVDITPEQLAGPSTSIRTTVRASQFALPSVESIYDFNARDTFSHIGDNDVDVEMDIRTASRMAFGSSGYVAVTVDDDAEVWDEDSIQVRLNGEALSRVSGLSEDEADALDSKSAVFDMPEGFGLAGRSATLELRVLPHEDFEYDGVTYDDVNVELFARGDIEDDEEVLQSVAFTSGGNAINTVVSQSLQHDE